MAETSPACHLTGNREREFRPINHPLVSYAGSEYSDTQAVPDSPDALKDGLRVGFLGRKHDVTRHVEAAAT